MSTTPNNQKPPSLLQAALEYLDRGFSIFPCGPDKRPLVKWEPYQKQRATKEEVELWWKKSPTAMIAVSTGTLSGVSVIDIDEPSGIDAVSKYLSSARVPTVNTPSGGTHLYFKTPTPPLHNNARLIPGCDFRGEGGYIIAPPSTNGSEQSYQWLPGLSLKDIDPPELPKAYIDFVQQKISLGEKVNKLQEGWERECFGAREGERNNSLTRLAGRYVTKGLSKEEILPLLESINQQFSPPLPNREVETILDSIWKRDHRQKEPLPNQEALSYEDLNLQSSLEISRLETRVEWIVKNLIPKDGNTLLHSIGGVGKSYLLYQLGKRVSAGEEFFGLSTMKMPVYYVDFENPLPEIVDRMKKIGGTDNLKIWHLSHEPGPVRFDADEWEVYKTFPPGLFIIDSLRSSYLDEENSSKVAAFIMARFKEVRSMGNTVILIHHENKIGSYRGSTAWFDLSDHILKFSRVKEIGSDKDVDDDNFNLPIRLGLGGKSRFSSALELKPMFFKFENQLLVRAEDPENEPLENLRKILVGMGDSGGIPPTQGDFIKLIRKEFQVGKDKARSMIKKGEGVYWDSIVNRSLDNRVTYSPIFKEGEV